MRKLFYVFNFALLAVFAAAVAVDQKQEWKPYQRGYNRKMAAELKEKLARTTDGKERKALKSEVRRWKWRGLEIKQILVKDLDRVDRCITCHVGMDEFTNPTLANSFDEHPYKAHPDVSGIVKNHPFQKFGCTTCHGGQGIATTAKAAHEGNIVHVGGESLMADEHLLKGTFLQASCAKCHADVENLKGAEVVSLGKKLFDANGCKGCHSVNGVGGVVSVDLGDVADKPGERIAPHDFHLARMPAGHEDISVQNWILAHLIRDPMDFVHNDPEGKYNAEPIAPSGMPPYYLEWKKDEKGFNKEAIALTTYLLSLTHEKIPHTYYRYAPPKPEPKFAGAVEHGKYVFQKYGCAGCHGVGAQQGRRNFNAMGPGQDPENKTVEEMAKGRVPTLPETVGTFTREELKKKIQDGVPSSAVAKYKDAYTDLSGNQRTGPIPALYMPSWKDKIKGAELESLVTYLLSIAKKGEEW